MIDWITIVSIVMTLIFLFAVYEGIRHINKDYERFLNYRELNDLSESIPEGYVIYPLTKTDKGYTEKRSSQEPLRTPYEPVIKKYEDANISSSQTLLDHAPLLSPNSNFNRLILKQLSQNS